MVKPFEPFRACLYCAEPVETFEPGPKGGAAQNMTCRFCGARYNLVVHARDGGPADVPLFLEILEPPP
jgi:hypothetical protein